MIITTSRNAKIFQKRFCKHLAKFLPEVRHIPRGETTLKKIFEKSNYIGYNHLLLVGKKKDNIKLLIYKRKDKEYFPEKLFTITDVLYKKPKKKITTINAKGKLFYFLEEIDKDSETKAKQENNTISFEINKELFFSFKIKEESL